MNSQLGKQYFVKTWKKKTNITTLTCFVFEQGFQFFKDLFTYNCLHLILTKVSGKHFYIFCTDEEISAGWRFQVASKSKEKFPEKPRGLCYKVGQLRLWTQGSTFSAHNSIVDVIDTLRHPQLLYWKLCIHLSMPDTAM